MSKLILLISIFCTYLVINLADYIDRPGRFLKHNRKVINCAIHKREAHQHSCVLAPFTTEGPFFITDDMKRSDLRDGQKGTTLQLKIRLTNAKDCSPIPGFFVHIWQANATGKYSAVPNSIEQNFRPEPVSDDRALRGYQETDADGEVEFMTFLPGWYPGRTIHIHIEVYPTDTTDASTISYIGQFYFEREIPLQLKKNPPYSTIEHEIKFNEQDGIFIKDRGNETILDIKHQGDTFSTFVTVAIDPEVTISLQ